MDPIDLTLPISQSLPSFPGSPTPQFIRWSKIKKDGYNLELLFLSSHSGTHIDAPYHFIDRGPKIHEIPPRRLISEAILIKIRKGANQNITKKDIITFEKKHGKIPRKSTVVFETGWQKNLKKAFFFTKNPGLNFSAADYLVKKSVNLVGIDSPSIDTGNNSSFPVHQIFSKNNILIVENLCNLNRITTSSFNLVILPLKLVNATGSPVRAVAI